MPDRRGLLQLNAHLAVTVHIDSLRFGSGVAGQSGQTDVPTALYDDALARGVAGRSGWTAVPTVARHSAPVEPELAARRRNAVAQPDAAAGWMDHPVVLLSAISTVLLTTCPATRGLD